MKPVLRRPLFPLGTLLVTLAVAGVQPASAQFNVYLSAPKSTATIYSSTSIENFEEFSTGVYSSNLVGTIGTFDLTSSTKLAIEADNQYGTGTGNYAALGAESSSPNPVTLELSSPQSYFGFSWNAGDRNNELFFYNGSQLVGSYSTATVTGLLSGVSVTTVGGQTYSSRTYYGQPVSGQNTNEPYAFINFLDSAGTFNKIVFGNSNTTSTGFEFDNLTVRNTTPPPDNSFVYVGSAVPEPSIVTLLVAIGLPGTFLVTRRRKSGK